MAKPGSSSARRIANGARAVDLTRATLSDAEVSEAQGMLEAQLGMRCSGCGRRIGVGFAFVSIAPRESAPVIRMAACDREDCDQATKLQEVGTACEMIEFAWVDDLGVDAAPVEVPGRRTD